MQSPSPPRDNLGQLPEDPRFPEVVRSGLALLSAGAQKGLMAPNRTQTSRSADSRSSSRGYRLFWVAKLFLCLLIVAFVARYIWLHWQTVSMERPPAAGWLLLGSALGLTGLSLFGWLNQSVILAHNVEISYQKSVGLFFVPMLGKYFPGKVWTLLGGLWLYAREGISKKTAAICIGVVTVLTQFAAGILAVSSPLFPDFEMATGWFLLFVLASFFFLVRPPIFYTLLNTALRLLGRGEAPPLLSASILTRSLALAVLGWLLYGSGFYCIARSVTEVEATTIPRFCALFGLAQVAGFVAFFAPAGIGVREGLFLLGLQPIVGSGQAIVIAALCRLWQTLLELLMAAAGWMALGRTET